VRRADEGDALVLLAGGRSRRFGSDKALARFGERRSAKLDAEEGETLALRALRRLEGVAQRRILVRATPLAGMPRGVARIADPRPGEGPLQALAAAFAAAPAARWFVAPCDLPWLDAAVYARLADELGSAIVVAARAPDGLEPLVSLWTPPAAARLERWLAEEPRLAVHAALERLGAREVDFPDALPFLNVNTQDDLAQARSASPPMAGAASRPRGALVPERRR
jgi:molybdopterin-guanine dinucleotide biosynthesis protein A